MADKIKYLLNQNIEVLQSQLKEKQQEYLYNELAKQLAMLKKAFIDNGFTEEQAYELTITILRNQGGGMIK